MKKSLFSSLMALGAAMIWGLAFVAQTQNTMGTWTINALRAGIAFLFLLPVIKLFDRKGKLLREENKTATRKLWIGGMLCGAALSAASFLQQYGIDQGIPAGKAGFITALYMSLVPLFGLFLRKKTRWFVWIAAGLAVISLYLLCVRDGLTIELRDIWVILCAVMFAVQILIIDHYTALVNCVRLSCIQFLTTFVLCSVPALLTETFEPAAVTQNLFPILYLGIASSAIGYTLQMLAQKGSNPAAVSILLSMESVFSVIFGALVSGEVLSSREYAGCAIMFLAVLLTQADLIFPKKQQPA